MTFEEVKRLIKLGREMGLKRLSVNGLVVEYGPTLPPSTLPAISGVTADSQNPSERMPTDDELLFASVEGIDVVAKAPVEDAA